jgi:peptidylamidoglycolate lyase
MDLYGEDSHHDYDSSTHDEFDNRVDRKVTQKSVYHVVPSWPEASVKLGQASGVDFDTEHNVVIFHRGDRQWGYETFDLKNNFLQKDLGPIQSNTVYVIHPTSGKVLHEWGSNM